MRPAAAAVRPEAEGSFGHPERQRMASGTQLMHLPAVHVGRQVERCGTVGRDSDAVGHRIAPARPCRHDPPAGGVVRSLEFLGADEIRSTIFCFWISYPIRSSRRTSCGCPRCRAWLRGSSFRAAWWRRSRSTIPTKDRCPAPRPCRPFRHGRSRSAH